MYQPLTHQLSGLPYFNDHQASSNTPVLKRLHQVTSRRAAGQHAAKTFQRQIISKMKYHLKAEATPGSDTQTDKPAAKPASSRKAAPSSETDGAAKTARKWVGGEGLTRTAVKNLMWTEGLKAFNLYGMPNEVYQLNVVPHHRVVWVIRGSITFYLPDEKRHIILNRGDRLDLRPGTPHQAIVGPEKFLCLEAYRIEH